MEKKSFKDAKEAAQRSLEECPKEVIQRFINRSWRFMSAYRKGLTGAAAAWAVRKQKQHRAINQTVMMAIDVLMNPAAPVSWVTEGCQPYYLSKSFLKNLAQPKTRGKNTKISFLSSFCLSGIGSGLGFSPKILVLEILNWLGLIVRNCIHSSLPCNSDHSFNVVLSIFDSPDVRLL